MYLNLHHHHLSRCKNLPRRGDDRHGSHPCRGIQTVGSSIVSHPSIDRISASGASKQSNADPAGDRATTIVGGRWDETTATSARQSLMLYLRPLLLSALSRTTVAVSTVMGPEARNRMIGTETNDRVRLSDSGLRQGHLEEATSHPHASAVDLEQPKKTDRNSADHRHMNVQPTNQHAGKQQGIAQFRVPPSSTVAGAMLFRRHAANEEAIVLSTLLSIEQVNPPLSQSSSKGHRSVLDRHRWLVGDDAEQMTFCSVCRAYVAGINPLESNFNGRTSSRRSYVAFDRGLVRRSCEDICPTQEVRRYDTVTCVCLVRYSILYKRDIALNKPFYRYLHFVKHPEPHATCGFLIASVPDLREILRGGKRWRPVFPPVELLHPRSSKCRELAATLVRICPLRGPHYTRFVVVIPCTTLD